ncbi:LysR family transcriptional regulator [Xanthobacter autotrophicus]|uniref:LysR family transcriptional regulator n=1 Tax=Xanthobacter autotrophicus TaxID=280 RepID=UPI003728A59D
MRIRHLQYFIAVAEERNFSRAAERVNIEASPLSRAIKDLEDQLGVQLLHRSKGRIELTWPGEIFRDEARRMLEFFDGAQSRVRSAAVGFRGRLRIGLADSLAQPRLAQLLARCREEEPLTEIRFREMTVREMLSALVHSQIDAGFTVDGEPMEGLQKEPVWTERPVIAIPRHHPLLALDRIPLREALRYPLVLCHPEQCAGGYKVIKQWLCGFPTHSPTIAEYVSGHEPMMLLVAAGYGIGLGLESQCALYNQPDVIVRPATDEAPNISTYVVIPDRPISNELERFIERARQIGGRIAKD